MKLSAPLFRLKRTAKDRARAQGIPLHQALNQITRAEGFASWSLLAARAPGPHSTLLPHLRPGELLLIAARPGLGKTLKSIQLLVEAASEGRNGYFFTLEFTREQVQTRLEKFGATADQIGQTIQIDCSDHIDAGYIIRRLGGAPSGTVAVVMDHMD